MIESRTIVQLCLITRCILQVDAELLSTIKRLEASIVEIREAIVDTSNQLKIFYKYFISKGNIPEEKIPQIIEKQAAKIIAEKNLRQNLTDVIHFYSCPPFLKHTGFQIANLRVPKTNVTEWQVRSILKLMADLRTVLPMNRVHMKATNRTVAYALKNENLLRFFLCFTSPEDDRIYQVTGITPLEKFTQFFYPYWIETLMNLVREDANLKSEFERPTERDMETVMFTKAEYDGWQTAPIVFFVIGLNQIGDLDEMNYLNYRTLRAMTEVASKTSEDAKKLNNLFWFGVTMAGENQTEYDVFNIITKRIEEDILLWEKIKDAEEELDALNVRQRSILLQDSE